MAITIGDKTYRNLPEQVEENANNIQSLLDTIASMGNVMRYKGSVPTYADLPESDNQIGDVWNVLDTGNNYAWDGEAWDEISSIVDLSGYAQKAGIAPEYDETSTYAVGDIVYYEENLYKCNTAIGTAETWDSTHWTQIVLADEAVTLSKDQTITGTKTFELPLKLKFGNFTFKFDDGTFGQMYIGRDGTNAGILLDGTTLRSGQHTPNGNGTVDLGSSGLKWKNLYLSGYLSDGNNTNYGLTLPDTTGWTANTQIIVSATNQTISGVKTTKEIRFVNDVSNPIGNILSIRGDNGYNAKITFGGNGIMFQSSGFVVGPTTNNSVSLGTSNYQWKDLYLAGNLSDGTNTVTVAQLASHTALYKHSLVLSLKFYSESYVFTNESGYTVDIIDNDSTPIDLTNIMSRLKSAIKMHNCFYTTNGYYALVANASTSMCFLSLSSGNTIMVVDTALDTANSTITSDTVTKL